MTFFWVFFFGNFFSFYFLLMSWFGIGSLRDEVENHTPLFFLLLFCFLVLVFYVHVSICGVGQIGNFKDISFSLTLLLGPFSLAWVGWGGGSYSSQYVLGREG